MEDEKTRLWNSQSGLCFWCGEEMDQKANSNDDKYPTIDHIIPKVVANGKKDNKRLACRGCNTLRGQYNTALWKSQQKQSEKIISRQGDRIGRLYTENKKLQELLIKFLEQSWWKKLFVKIARFNRFIEENR